MKKLGPILLVVGVVILFLVAFFVGTYNGIIASEENVETKLSDVKVQLERRANLIPNLVNTVKGYAAHEETIIKEISDARKKMNGASTVKEMDAADKQLSSALGALNVVIENYPDLKADKTFINLQDELAGTENRVATARNDYNKVAKEYNTKIKSIPTNIIAGMMSKTQKDYFNVTSSEKEKNPTVDFSE